MQSLAWKIFTCRAFKMAAHEAYDAEMAIFHQPNTPIIQFLCLFPHSMGQWSQCWWDITDRMPGWQKCVFLRYLVYEI